MRTSRRLVPLADIVRQGGGQGYRYEGDAVPLDLINVLPQPRKTFEGLEELALDIAKKKLLNPPTVAKFGRAECRDYLAVINHLWGTGFSVDDLRPSVEGGFESFYVLLAGERRFRSCLLLWTTGCQECRETLGAAPEGDCFRRHFGGDAIDVRLCLGIAPLPALFLQLSENTHMAVPPHEEALAYALLFKLIRRVDKDFSVSRFAREVGRSPETVRKALRFCELPESVREAVEKGRVAYGIATEIARLRENGAGDGEMRWWLNRAVVENLKVPDFRERVSRHLLLQRSGQMTLAGIFKTEQEAELRRAHIRRTVAANMIGAVWTWVHYLERVRALFECGDLGREDSPFSERSPIRVFRTFIEKIRQLTPHLKELLPESAFERARLAAAEAEKIAGLLERTSGDEGRR